MTASGQDGIAAEFETHRSHLLGVGYRLTASMADAEDAAQEAWLRLAALSAEQRAGIRDLRAWLTTVTGRICLDRLRSAAVRRESYPGPWLPEPVVAGLAGQPGENPADVIARDEEFRMAALVVLAELPPEQRVAFVLHDGFDVPFADIAATLGCSVPAARQYASRGRRTVHAADPPPRVDLAEQHGVLERFVAAVNSGDVAEVLAVLHPGAVLTGDGGGKAQTARHVMHGADKIARFFAGLRNMHGEATFAGLRPVLVNGDLGALLPETVGAGGRVIDRRVLTFAVRDGLIVALYDVVNPDKLARLPAGITDGPVTATPTVR